MRLELTPRTAEHPGGMVRSRRGEIPIRMDKVLLITGASRGIGAATARLAATRGYSVCVNYKENRDAAEAVVKAVEAAGRKAVAVAADVGVEADVERLFEVCSNTLGPLAALVNN